MSKNLNRTIIFNSVTLKNTQTDTQKNFFSTKQIIFRVGGWNKKLILEIKFYHAQGHNTKMPVRLEPSTSRSQVKHSTIEPLRSYIKFVAPVIFLLTVPRQCYILWILFVIYVSLLSLLDCLVCSLQPCDHLLGKGWPLGSLVCGVSLCFCHFPIMQCLGLGVELDCINSWSFLLLYFQKTDIGVVSFAFLRFLNLMTFKFIFFFLMGLLLKERLCAS